MNTKLGAAIAAIAVAAFAAAFFLLTPNADPEDDASNARITDAKGREKGRFKAQPKPEPRRIKLKRTVTGKVIGQQYTPPKPYEKSTEAMMEELVAAYQEAQDPNSPVNVRVREIANKAERWHAILDDEAFADLDESYAHTLEGHVRRMATAGTKLSAGTFSPIEAAREEALATRDVRNLLEKAPEGQQASLREAFGTDLDTPEAFSQGSWDEATWPNQP